MADMNYLDVKLSEAYKEHTCFKELEDMKEFYDNTSDRSYLVVPLGTKSLLNFESYVFMSIYGTLDSIKFLLMDGKINDAFVLVRKYYDDILADIYLQVLLKENNEIGKGLVVEDVQQWLETSYRIPSSKKILQTLMTSPTTKDLYPFFGWKTHLKRIREILDDCVHANRYSCMLFNCNKVYLGDKKEKQLDKMLIILRQLMKIQVAFMFHLNSEYLMASDYRDYIEEGMQPPEGSESWIAPYAQKAFDKYIKPDVKLATFIKSACYLDIC